MSMEIGWVFDLQRSWSGRTWKFLEVFEGFFGGR